ncbi:MAG: AarF/ABC1/UbiB kinase family protein [Parcubacteria group bacterium]|nr:AarF/ABC1/UbiB kinase family protein [Parcubacteria group bacterium]
MPNPTAQRIIPRACRVAFVAFAHLIAYIIHGRKNVGLEIRKACEELGPVFMKLGQLLSTRYEFLSREDCAELQKLLDAAPRLSPETIDAIFIADFGKPPEQCFAQFDEAPIASASIAQVHRATLPDGARVAVKIRRPHITRTISLDIRILYGLIRIAQLFSRTLRHLDIKEVLRQLETWILLETDFIHEAQNIKKISGYYAARGRNGDPYAAALVFPAVHPAFSSANVITMDFLEGIPVHQHQRIANNPEYDTYRSLKAFLGSNVRAWMDGDSLYFHGDPHPANTLIMKDGRVGVLDFGLLGFLDAQKSAALLDLVLSVYAQNLEETIRNVLRVCNAPYAPFADAIRDDMAAYLLETRTSSFGFWFAGFMRILFRHRIPLPYAEALFCRAHVLVDGLFETAVPGKTTLDIMGDELGRGLRRRIVRNVLETDIGGLLYDISRHFKSGPALVTKFLDRYVEHPLDLLRDIRSAL